MFQLLSKGRIKDHTFGEGGRSGPSKRPGAPDTGPPLGARPAARNDEEEFHQQGASGWKP